MIQITRHAIKRYKERIMPCSDLEAELNILKAAVHGILLSRRGKYKAVQYGPAVLIIYENGGIATVKTIEHVKFSGWWKKEKMW
ncbi:conserved hypothetical protein [Caldicellulosiruptor hydrothermalis 108]|uniref:Uncharacterized protein n=2 Tax=Caldicellulosiruptor TaxID=44000 RepID=E4QBF3_CALH1|nr:conserved hypothetical protein [Caldicellulosiruptor hydrothermalis 108]